MDREQDVRDVLVQKAIDDLRVRAFSVFGSCACDGAYDDGCPACTPEKREAWEAEIRAVIEKYR